MYILMLIVVGSICIAVLSKIVLNSITFIDEGGEDMECPCCGYPMEYKESPFMNELGEPEAYFWVCADPKCGYTTDHNGNPIKRYEEVGV